jgi:hypothetical protein
VQQAVCRSLTRHVALKRIVFQQLVAECHAFGHYDGLIHASLAGE